MSLKVGSPPDPVIITSSQVHDRWNDNDVIQTEVSTGKEKRTQHLREIHFEHITKNIDAEFDLSWEALNRFHSVPCETLLLIIVVETVDFEYYTPVSP